MRLPGLLAPISVLVLFALGQMEMVDGCSCYPAHPQEQFCRAEIVIRVKVIGEKIVSSSDVSRKTIQYEVKLIKMFKGFEKVKDIQYIYTSFFSSLCGVKLNAKKKVQYLLFARIRSDGKVWINLCNLVEPWEDLNMSHKKNLNSRYHMGCDCRIVACHTLPCSIQQEKQCLWIDYLLNNDVSVGQASKYACIKRSDGSCSWYSGALPMGKNFLDMKDP